MLETVQGIVVLVFALTILLIVVSKLRTSERSGTLEVHFVVAGGAVLMFFALLATELFRPQGWSPDVLKVVAGVVIGLGAGIGTTNVRQVIAGDRNIQATNARIERMEGDIHELKDSIVKTVNQAGASTANPVTGHLPLEGTCA